MCERKERNDMKKLFAILMSIMMIACFMPTMAFAVGVDITLSQTEAYSFTAKEVGYEAAPEALEVTSTNGSADTATGALKVALEGENADKYFTVTPGTVTSIEGNKTGTFTVQPKTGLEQGDYSATVKVSGDGVNAALPVVGPGQQAQHARHQQVPCRPQAKGQWLADVGGKVIFRHLPQFGKAPACSLL